MKDFNTYLTENKEQMWKVTGFTGRSLFSDIVSGKTEKEALEKGKYLIQNYLATKEKITSWEIEKK